MAWAWLARKVRQLWLGGPAGPRRRWRRMERALTALGDQTGASTPGTAGEHRPPAPDEIAMPAQERLRADQERDPDRARQASAETGERQTISRPPARPLDLALEDTQLVSEDQELQPEVGVGPLAVDEGVEEQTEGGIEDREKHGQASWQVGPLPGAGPLAVPRSGFLDRTGRIRRVCQTPFAIACRTALASRTR